MNIGTLIKFGCEFTLNLFLTIYLPHLGHDNTASFITSLIQAYNSSKCVSKEETSRIREELKRLEQKEATLENCVTIFKYLYGFEILFIVGGIIYFRGKILKIEGRLDVLEKKVYELGIEIFLSRREEDDLKRMLGLEHILKKFKDIVEESLTEEDLYYNKIIEKFSSLEQKIYCMPGRDKGLSKIVKDFNWIPIFDKILRKLDCFILKCIKKKEYFLSLKNEEDRIPIVLFLCIVNNYVQSLDNTTELGDSGDLRDKFSEMIEILFCDFLIQRKIKDKDRIRILRDGFSLLKTYILKHWGFIPKCLNDEEGEIKIINLLDFNILEKREITEREVSKHGSLRSELLIERMESLQRNIDRLKKKIKLRKKIRRMKYILEERLTMEERLTEVLKEERLLGKLEEKELELSNLSKMEKRNLPYLNEKNREFDIIEELRISFQGNKYDFLITNFCNFMISELNESFPIRLDKNRFIEIVEGNLERIRDQERKFLNEV